MERLWRGEAEEPVEQRESVEAAEEPTDFWDDILAGEVAAIEAGEVVDWDLSKAEEPEPTDQPEKPYRGGRYSDLPREPGRDRHHLIPAWNLEQAGRDPVAGLAVQMDRADHMKTKSWGSSPRAAKYRADVARLMDADDEAQALRLGVEDVENIAPGKYARALDEACNAEG